MLFSQFAHTDSLRETCNGLSCRLGKLVHLGIGKAPNKSTLSYANEHRPDALFEDLLFITEARCSDVKMAASFFFNPGTIVALDRGYADYKLFARWAAEEIYFVTRLKENAVYEVAEECAVPENRGILSDRLIRLTPGRAPEDCPCRPRRAAVWDTDNEREIVLLTNHLEFGQLTIAAIYRDRWKIELFFNALKQNLKIKSFIGTSENALRI